LLVNLRTEEDVLEDDFIIPAPKLATDQPGVVYVAFKKLAGVYLVLVVVAAVLWLAACRVDFFAGEPEDVCEGGDGLPDTVLENVTVVATPDEEDVLEDDFIIPAPKLATDSNTSSSSGVATTVTFSRTVSGSVFLISYCTTMCIPAPKLATDQPGVVYVAFKKLAGENSVPVTSFTKPR
jgi:hypothetical protein